MVKWVPVISSIALAAALATADSFSRRASIPDSCPLDHNTWSGDVFTSFTGLVANDFTVGGGGKEIAGRLAVGGTFTARDYTVNAGNDVDCTGHQNNTSFTDQGLVAVGKVNPQNVAVNGYSVLLGGGDISGIQPIDPACTVSTEPLFGELQLRIAQDAAVTASSLFAFMEPHYSMDANGKVTKLYDGAEDKYAVFKFHSCEAENCSTSGQLSDPTGFLFNTNGTYKGMTGDVPSSDKTVIFNIPVTQSDTITITNDLISEGLNPCKTIFNFYAVDMGGGYDFEDVFTVNRTNAGPISGFTLAVRGNIIDGPLGGFVGQIVSNAYTWGDMHTGPSILSYASASDQCTTFDGCFPTRRYYNPTQVHTETAAVKTVGDATVETVYAVPYVEESDKKGWGRKGKKGGWDGVDDKW
ncbi:hypothetical protein BJV82DRAFT_598639 [Fennellomyces sp. T-0311]|nr:hypothetical protein BJV82DRAFT_598639 [Fennellomyces sp. T-0311]